MKAISEVATGQRRQDATQENIKSSPNQEVGPTAKRYIILLLFCLNSGNKAYQWIHVSASTTKATRLYQVDNYVINFASTVFMLSFLVVSWPACFIIERIGIRKAVLLASFGALLGSTVKCFSLPINYFQGYDEDLDADSHDQYNGNVYLMLLGQCLVSIGEQMIFSVPSRLVSIWFPDNQVSVATAFSILGNQMGIAAGFLLPTHVFLVGAETRQEICRGFSAMFLATALFSSALFLLNWVLFDEAPVRAPGEARRKQIEVEECEKASRNIHLGSQQTESTASQIRLLLSQIVALCKNRDLMLVALSYGISLGRGDAISTLMDQTVSSLYPREDAESIAGLTGCLIIVSGALGLPVWGRLLDNYRAYKSINIILSIFTTFTLILMAYVMIHLKWLTGLYAVALTFGFFQMGFLIACMELAVEITYPGPELVTSSLLNTMCSVFGPAFVVIGSYVVDTYGPLATYIFYMVTLLVAFICILSSRERLKRQEAIEESKSGLRAADFELC